MSDYHVDFTEEKPLDVPWPDEIREVRAELEGLQDIDMVQILQEVSKIRLEVIRASKKKPEGVQPLSEEKGVRFLTTAINELRRLTPEVANLRNDVEDRVREEHLLSLFPVVDAFDRFFESVKDIDDVRFNKWVEGIRGIYNSVLQIFRQNDVKEIPARGTFNPKYQAAVATETRNDVPPDTIIGVQRRGFVIGKKILRTPEVIISKRDDLIE